MTSSIRRVAHDGKKTNWNELKIFECGLGDRETCAIFSPFHVFILTDRELDGKE